LSLLSQFERNLTTGMAFLESLQSSWEEAITVLRPHNEIVKQNALIAQ